MEQTNKTIRLTGNEALCLQRLLREELGQEIENIELTQEKSNGHIDTVLILQLNDKKVKYRITDQEGW